jgi:NADP-dependent 3-hydroxy acid dehydrogenase YdfG
MPDDPVLLITGARTGSGAATARHAAEAGWRLVLAARSEDKLDSLASELGGDPRAIAVRCDVTSWDDQEALVAAALDAFGQVDAVFANAGFGAARGFLNESPEHWKSMVDTNVTGLAYTIRATLPHLKERGTGHYVITSSVAGRRALPGSLYAATKHAATAIGEGLRQELRGDDATRAIRVTLIEPGMVDTPFFENRPESAL